MRTIKYRAWTGTKMVIPNEIRWNDDGSIREINTEGLSNIPGCDRWPLLEFTGLKDKNGVEIYEGDIVRVTDDDDGDVVAKIQWCDSGMWCAGERNEYGFDFVPSLGNLTLSDYHKVEIIGNIYENPELLKGEGND